MIRTLKVRVSQGRQYILDMRQARLRGFRGRPVIAAAPPCDDGCKACIDVCPTTAISAGPLKIDLGRCIFCGDCALACPPGKIQLTAEHRMAADSAAGLVVREGETDVPPVKVSQQLKAMFGRSLKLRSVSSGGCNGCELELNALGNVNFDLGRYGIEFVASPRHADALVLSGPLTKAMADALELTYAAIPEPKLVISFGACTISGGPYLDAPSLDRRFLERFAPALYVPGCPPHPLTFVSGIMDLLGIQ